jgi:hypothetical protein
MAAPNIWIILWFTKTTKGEIQETGEPYAGDANSELHVLCLEGLAALFPMRYDPSVSVYGRPFFLVLQVTLAAGHPLF